MLFIDFMRKEMESHPLGDKFKGDVRAFIAKHFSSMGFSKWLSEMRGETLSEDESFLVGKAYIEFGERKPSEIPTVLGLLTRQYNILFEVPAHYYEADFWESKFASH